MCIAQVHVEIIINKHTLYSSIIIMTPVISEHKKELPPCLHYILAERDAFLQPRAHHEENATEFVSK